MVEHKCDGCGQRVTRWYTITSRLDRDSAPISIVEYLNTKTYTKELCEGCFKNFWSFQNKE